MRVFALRWHDKYDHIFVTGGWDRQLKVSQMYIQYLLAHLSQRLMYTDAPASVVHNDQTSSSAKPLSPSKPNFVWSLYGYGDGKFVHGIWVM